MMNAKLFVLGICGLLWLPLSGLAAEFVSQPDVFTPDTLNDPTEAETYYGALSGYPHTFVFTIATTTSVRYQLGTAPKDDPVSLLIVREANRGVEEVARLTASEVAWTPGRDRRLGVALALSPEQTVTLEPGVYKAEVSNATNEGRYQLAVNGGGRGGFWSTLRESFLVHAFYGSWVTALLTWRILLIGGVVAAAWWWLRRKRINV